MATVPGIQLVSTANELNAAYAADGYARATGSLGCIVTTYVVGALSAINGVAGSFAEELPVLCVVGVPPAHQYPGCGSSTLHLHHTLGDAENMNQEIDCYKPVTCYHTTLCHEADARYLIDKALKEVLQHRKPALLEICRDIAMRPLPCFGHAPPAMTAFSLPSSVSDPIEESAAVTAVTDFFADKKMPLIIVGSRVRTMKDALLKLADATGWGVIVLHDGKGMFPEDHPAFIGCHFLRFTSSAEITQVYEAADGLLFVGTHFHELNFGAFPEGALRQRSVMAYKDTVLVGETEAFNQVRTESLLLALASTLKPNSAIVHLFRKLPHVPTAFPFCPDFTAPEEAPLKLAFVHALMTSAEIGSYVECGCNTILVCVNNDGYCIERYLSPLPEAGYNCIKRWNFAMLAEAMCNQEGKYKVFQVRTEAQAIAAIAEAKALSDHFIFMEVVVDKRDAAPCAGVLRETYISRHFDMQSYRRVMAQSAQTKSGEISGLATRDESGPDDQAEDKTRSNT
eukprot:gene8817-8996_t